LCSESFLKTIGKRGFMRRFFRTLLKKTAEFLEKIELLLKDDELQTPPVEVVLDEKVVVAEEKIEVLPAQKVNKTQEKSAKSPPKKKTSIIPDITADNPIRDMLDMMEFPFLALSKNRRNPIIYESADGTTKIKVTRHTGHFLASIYDWDIILVIAGKIQEIIEPVAYFL